MNNSVPSYTLVRSKRKTLALVIDDEGKLIARAPLKMSEKRIAAFVKQKRNWIHASQERVRVAHELYPPLTLEDGSSLPFLGESHVIVRNDVATITLSDTTLRLPWNTTEDDLIVWMKRKAKQDLQKRVRSYADLMQLEYAQVRISSARTRWGSCSAKNSLSFTWRLIMCPPEIIDYLVVHELSHIQHKNHGEEFWRQVGSVLPDYKKRRTWLKEHRGILQLL